MSIGVWTLIFVGGSFALYLAIAWWARVGDTKGFYVAGRGVPAAANGMATAADWIEGLPHKPGPGREGETTASPGPAAAARPGEPWAAAGSGAEDTQR